MIPRRIGSASAAKISSSAAPFSAFGTSASSGGDAGFKIRASRVGYPWSPSSTCSGRRVDDVPLQTVGDFQELRLFARRDTDAVERRGNVRHEDAPFGLGDAHPLVR